MRPGPAARLAIALAVWLATAAGAWAQTYTSGSTTYSFIDSSTHTKIGYNTAPYKFNQSSGCGSAPPVLDDVLSDAIPIGFTFTYGSTAYTTLYVMSNGRVQFGNTTCGYGTASIGPPQTYPYGYANASMNNTMKVFGVDLDPTNLVDKPNYPAAASKTPCLNNTTCYVSVATLGSAPSRKFVVTWKNVPEWVAATNTSGSFDVQVILNEDGTFVFQYGTVSHGGTGTAQIGWQLTTTNYQVLSFGASAEPPPNTAIKFYLPAPLASYAFDEGAWVPGLAGQVLDSSANALAGTALGGAQAIAGGRVCRAANIPLNTAAGTVDALRTGVNVSDPSRNLLGTSTVAFWYRSNAPWSGAGAQAAQLMDATAVAGEWFFLSKTSAGALVFEVKDSAGSVRSVTSPAQTFAANTWVHIAVTWNFNGNAGANQDALQVFVNAAAPTVSAFTSAGTVSAQTGYLHFGDNPLGIADTTGSVNSANGLIDEAQVYNYVLTTAQVATVMGSSRSCTALAMDHFEIRHASGSGITCLPSTLTIVACQNPACSTFYTGGVAGALSASGSPTVNWDGSTGNGAGSAFVVAGGSSSVTKGLQVVTAGSTLLAANGLSLTPSAGTSCNFGAPGCTFSAADSGFVVSTPNHVAESAQTVSVSAVKKSDGSLACTPAFANVSKAVNLRCSYTDPASGTLSARVAGVALNATNNAAAACDANGASVNLAFGATGVASASLQYADVGNLSLVARYTGSGAVDNGLVLAGTGSFTTRPQGFTLSAIRCTASGSGNCALAAPGNNPAAGSAAGAAFIPAGASFSATVTAVNAAGAATPNYGHEITPEGVKLTAGLAAPAGGNVPALSNPSAFGAFSGGSATGTTFAWNEVGIITLAPSVADGDYLGSGNVSGTASGNVGRFIPARFTVSAPSLTHRSALACSPASAFTYLGENFRLGFTLTAQNRTGGTTQNYAGSFAKFDPSAAAAWNLAGIAGSTMFSPASGRLSLGSASGSWAAGVASPTLTAAALRAAGVDGPFNASFGIAPVDSDGVAPAAYDLDTDSPANGNDRVALGTVALRFGRLWLANTIGAADRALALPAAAQYWTGSAFDTNPLDSCSVVPTAAVAFGNLRRTLTAADMLVSAPIGFAAGIGWLRLAAPGGGRSGTADVALSLGGSATDVSCLQAWTPAKAATAGANLAYLRGAWCSASYDKDAAARATFGLQRSQDNLIYRREDY